MRSTLTADAVVIGAGPTGLVAALALCAFGIEVVVAAPAYNEARSEADRRSSALLPSSVELLKNLGAWEHCVPDSTALKGVRIVDDRGGLLRAPEVLFWASELGLPDFGFSVTNASLIRALHMRASATATLRWLPTSAVVKVRPDDTHVCVELAEGHRLRATLVVGADGRASTVRAAAGIVARSWQYAQAGLVATFRHSRPHADIATELHRRTGPLTTVPLPGNSSSLVWVEHPAEAARLASLDDAAFLGELDARLQGLLGVLQQVGPRAVYPLSGLSATSMGQSRIALVGESAHVIPPIGAQGLNLGLRDAADLAECVGVAGKKREDIGASAVLGSYQAARGADVVARTLTVDLLNRSLLHDFLPVQALRGLGLHLLANVGPLRRLVMRGGMQGQGRLPLLMQPGGSSGS